MTFSQAQYDAVRGSAGLLADVDAGLLAVRGADRIDWLQGMVSNDVRLLQPGAPLDSFVLDPTGHVLSDLRLTAVDGPEAFVLASAPRAAVELLLERFDRLILMEDVEVQDLRGKAAIVSIQGPRAAARARELGTEGDPQTLLIPSDRTGSGGVDIVSLNGSVPALRESGILEIDAETLDLLRIEAGIPLFGRDMDSTAIALETGLGASHVSLRKGCYVGQEVLARIESRGHTNRQITGIAAPPGSDLAPAMRLYTEGADGKRVEVGRVTSAAPFSPSAGGRAIGLAYVRHEHRAEGTRLLAGEENSLECSTVSLPFFAR